MLERLGGFRSGGSGERIVGSIGVGLGEQVSRAHACCAHYGVRWDYIPSYQYVMDRGLDILLMMSNDNCFVPGRDVSVGVLSGGGGRALWEGEDLYAGLGTPVSDYMRVRFNYYDSSLLKVDALVRSDLGDRLRRELWKAKSADFVPAVYRFGAELIMKVMSASENSERGGNWFVMYWSVEGREVGRPTFFVR